ncbi:MAG: FAD-dependent oxidoreductase [Bacteroidia bacterium]|nr:FAD-dependent oxidoreductase [Bacteroidia bacterium]
MVQACQIEITPEYIAQPDEIRRIAARQAGVDLSRVTHHTILKRSVDARGRQVRYALRVQLWVDEVPVPEPPTAFPLQDVSHKPAVYIAGLGPAGLFAALHLIRLGIKPIILERGKSVRERRRDLAHLTREGVVNPESNYCFGEGGAGTFSDGKLYTRADKRGDVRGVLDTLVQFGATPEILVDAHPHIGTNKLPAIIQAMREAVTASGGEVHFETRLTGLEVQDGRLHGVMTSGGLRVPAQALILATGHSARDVFELLHQHGLAIEAKPFALGVRVEHPQALIDSIQYHCGPARSEFLPASSYSLVRQVEDRGVYSFCMCPGGIICPAATSGDEVVVNGWSPSRRNSPFANSGIVVQLDLADLGRPGDPLAGVRFQQQVEQKAFQAGGGKQVAPALRLTDFVNGNLSRDLPATSYLPGITPADFRAVLPPFVHKRLREGFRQFGKMMRGYLTEEAIVVATESRTSSPVRIPRDPLSLMHPQAAGLFPCGEGAGYAGGIMSAALDGARCAERAAAYVLT